MNALEQVEYESRVKQRYAIVAAVAGLLLLGSAVTGLLGPQAQVTEATLGLIYAHKRAAIDIAGAVLDVLAMIAEAVTLNWLWKVTKARDPNLRPIVRILAVGGAVLLGTMLLVYTVIQLVKAGQFVSSGQQTYLEAQRLTSGAVLAIPTLFADLGALSVTVGLIWVSLAAMRVGLLTRFLGYVGAFAGVLILFPFIQLPVVQIYWLIALGVLFLGRWPSGTPKAWSTGEAVPWPSAGQAREGAQARPQRQPRPKAGGGAPPRGGRRNRLAERAAILAAAGGAKGRGDAGSGADNGASATATAAAPAAEDAPAARTRANTPKRKRKHRK